MKGSVPEACEDLGMPPSRIVGYEVLASLYEDANGVIYRARNFQLNRLVALKLLRETSPSTADTARFLREAECLARCDHPNVVPVFEVGESEGLPYMVLGLTEGCSLAERLPALAGDAKAAVRVLIPVARALHHVHERGIVHRDVQPANVRFDSQGRPYLAGFYLARR